MSTEEHEENANANTQKGEMPFLEHLEELRWRLIRSIGAIFIGTFVAFFFSDYIMAFIQMPFDNAVRMHAEQVGLPANANKAVLIYLAPTEAFMVKIKLSIFAGLIIMLPYVFYQIWQFAVPGLLDNEKKYIPRIVAASTFFFLLGGGFCWAVTLRYGLAFLLGFQNESLQANITINEYLSFALLLIVTFGMVFELPLLSYFLTKMGIVSSRLLRDKRSYGTVSIFIIAALVTPPDVFTMAALAVPMLLLYELSVYVSKWVERGEPNLAEEPSS